MRHGVYIQLSDKDLSYISDMAKRERRTPQNQMAYLIMQAVTTDIEARRPKIPPMSMPLPPERMRDVG